MKSKVKKLFSLAWPGLCILGVVFVHLMRENWYCRARLNLLREGFLVCRFVPLAETDTKQSNTTFYAAVVLKDGACIGYLDRYANFVRAGREGGIDIKRAARSELVMLVLELGCVAGLLVWVGQQTVHLLSLWRIDGGKKFRGL